MAKRLRFVVEIDQPVGATVDDVAASIKGLLVALPLDDEHQLWSVSGTITVEASTDV